MDQIDLKISSDLPEIFKPAIDTFIESIQAIDRYQDSLTLKLVKGGLLSEIRISNNPTDKFYPHVKNGVVFVPSRFVFFLYSYSFYIYLTTEHVMIRELEKTWDGYLRDSQEVRWSFEFFEQYKRNRDGDTNWNNNLINPSTNCIASRDVNVLFSMALVFIYLHEISHIYLSHNGEMQDEAKIEAEKDADQNALKIFFAETDEINTKKYRSIALGSVQGASINSISTISRLISRDHPDIDVRLSHIIDYVQLNDDKSEYYFMTVVGISLSTFCREHSIKIEQKIFDTAKECYEYYLGEISKAKES